MQCQNYEKFVSFEDSEPEVQSIEVDNNGMVQASGMDEIY